MQDEHRRSFSPAEFILPTVCVDGDPPMPASSTNSPLTYRTTAHVAAGFAQR